MYSIGDRVIYASSGVFEVTDVRDERVMGSVYTYYVLRELGSDGDSQFFVPVGSPAEKNTMRPLMTKEQSLRLIAESADIAPAEWVTDTRQRSNAQKMLIESGDRRALIALIKVIDMKQRERQSEGKKPFLQDEHSKSRALKLLLSELCEVLSCEREEILGMLKL